MAFDRTTELNTTYIAYLLREDNHDVKTRMLVNAMMKAINKSGAEVQAASISTLKTAIDTALGL